MGFYCVTTGFKTFFLKNIIEAKNKLKKQETITNQTVRKLIFSIANIDIKYQPQAKKYAISVSSNGFLILFNIVGINQNISTIINNITEKNGSLEKIQSIIEKIQKISEI